MNIQIAPDTTSLLAGKKYTGKIILQVTKMVTANEIQMRLEGEETALAVATVSESGSGDSSRRQSESRGLVKHFLDVNHQSVIVNGQILPGNYDVAFSTTVPSSLPSSMEVHSREGYAKIEYMLHVAVKGSGWISNYKNRQAVQVQSAPEDVSLQSPFMKPPFEAKVRAFCCLGRGSIHWGVKVDDTHICPGQSVGVNLSCVNDSTSTIEKVTGSIKQHVTWRAHLQHEAIVDTLHEIDFGTMSDNAMEAQTKEELRMSGTSMTHTTEIQARILSELEKGTNRKSIPSLNPSALTTYKGKLMDIEHKLHLVLKTGTCVTDPHLEIPLKIVTANNVESPPPASSAPPPASAPVANPSPVEAVEANSPTEEEVVVETVKDETPSVSTLVEIMKITTNDLAIVREKKHDPTWKSVLQAMKPADLRKILAQVDLDTDQTNVMTELASEIDPFTPDHLMAAIGRASEWNRTNMIEGLLPFCALNAESAKKIQDSLSSWERMVTENAFEKALK